MSLAAREVVTVLRALARMFRAFEKDQDGFVTRGELGHVSRGNY